MEGYEGERVDVEMDAVHHEELVDCYRGLALGDCASRCEDLNTAGCTLAWLVVHAKGIHESTGCSKVWDMIFTSGVWRQASRNRLALPLKLGALVTMWNLLGSLSLDAATQVQFTSNYSEKAWMLVVIVALNMMYGFGRAPEFGSWSKAELRVTEAIGLAIRRMLSHGAIRRHCMPSEEKELMKKRINYQGEEVGVCHKLTFEQVLPALPPVEHGASISCVDFVSEQTKEWLLNPGRSLVSDVGQELPKLQGKVHVAPDHIGRIADELVRRGVCDWVPLSSVVQFREQTVLNGLFGVEKAAKTESGLPVLRLIMNLVPINSIMRQYTGAVKHLPSITSWMSVVLEENQEVRVWQSDMCNAFYLIKLPEIWRYYLAFNVLKTVLDPQGREVKMALACCVLPMGWSSSVALMQEISEELLKIKPLKVESQLLRQKAVPLWMTGIISEAVISNRSWWHVYLDNFAAGEVGDSDSSWNGGDTLHQLAEECWSLAGVLSSEKKRKRVEVQAEELGAFIDGDAGTIGGSPTRFLGLIQNTLFILSLNALNKKLLQVIVGRWIHVMQFRRPAMCILSAVWDFIGKTPIKRKGLVSAARRELFGCMCLVPLLHTFLGAQVSKIITASDASMKGGAVGIARQLTPVGIDYVNGVLGMVNHLGEIPVLVISLFNGIGGAFRTYDLLGVRPMGLISFDIHSPANRIVSRIWPHCEIFLDVKKFSRSFFKELLMKYLGIKEVHLWAGFPCIDLSSVNKLGKGLDGPASGLFFEVLRIIKIIKEELPSTVALKEVIENVASMARDQVDRISRHLGREPYFFDCSDAVPMRRPRLCWTTECLRGIMDDVTVRKEGCWLRVTASAPYPKIDDWISENVDWPGGRAGTILPTAMKAIKREKPPFMPAGIERCDEDTLGRYEADDFRYPPYQYKEPFLFYTKHGSWRLVSCEEKELLMGYGWQHTSQCYSASQAKQSRQRYLDERHSLLGDSFSIYSFIIPAVALCQHFIPRIQYKLLAQRMGMAPGFRSPIRLVAPLKRTLQYGYAFLERNQTVETLNRVLLSRVNHTGSDVRIATGELLNPKAHPRQGVQSDWWDWKPSFAVKWARKEHINILELRSIFLALRYHISHLGGTQFRLFHLSDSYVCLSILGKGRTSSKSLSRVLRQLNAHLLAHGVTLVMGHVDSMINPTDGASRAVENRI